MPDADITRVAHELHRVVSNQRLATGEVDFVDAHLRQLTQDILPLLRGQLVAGEITPARAAHALQVSVKSLLTFTRLVVSNLMYRREIHQLLEPPPLPNQDEQQFSLALCQT